jgi:hypothetical protein
MIKRFVATEPTHFYSGLSKKFDDLFPIRLEEIDVF